MAIKGHVVHRVCMAHLGERDRRSLPTHCSCWHGGGTPAAIGGAEAAQQAGMELQPGGKGLIWCVWGLQRTAANLGLPQRPTPHSPVPPLAARQQSSWAAAEMGGELYPRGGQDGCHEAGRSSVFTPEHPGGVPAQGAAQPSASHPPTAPCKRTHVFLRNLPCTVFFFSGR